MDDGEPFGSGGTFASLTVAERIATGGMSVLYRAVDPALGRTVALKVMASDLSSDDSFRRRFLAECRAASAIDHPNVIPLYTAGEHEGRLYITMRYVPGGSDLRKLLRASAPFDPELAVGVLAQVAAALDAVHASGLVHRDVKPENLLLAATTSAVPHVYLTDFGISRGASGSTVTQPGSIVGTLAYAAPEQITSDPVSPRTDVYGLACVTFECLTGKRPFMPDNEAGLLYAHLHEVAPLVSSLRPGLPAAVDAAVARGLAKDPADRPPSAGAFMLGVAEALGVAVPGLSTPPPGANTAPTPIVGADAATVPFGLSTPSAITRDASVDGLAGGGGPGGADPGGGRTGKGKVLVAASILAVLLLVSAVAALSRGGGDPQLVSAGDSTSTAPRAADGGVRPTDGSGGTVGTDGAGSTIVTEPGGSLPPDGTATSVATTDPSITNTTVGNINPTTSQNGPTTSQSGPTTSQSGPTTTRSSTTTTTKITFAPSAPRSVFAKDPQSTPVCDAHPDTVTITVEWQVPQSDGGETITGYRISAAAEGEHMGQGYTTTKDVAGNVTSTQITVKGQPTGVTGGNWSYGYQVVAINAKGSGPSARARAVMDDFVADQVCEWDYWRRSRAVGIRGWAPNAASAPSCGLVGRIYDQSPFTAGLDYPAATVAYIKAYGPC